MTDDPDNATQSIAHDPSPPPINRHRHPADCRTPHAGREVEQPTVLDAASFAAWKDEAFALWATEWGALYDAGSAARGTLEAIRASWWLVAVVDDDFAAPGGGAGGALFPALLAAAEATAAAPAAAANGSA